jgi:fatty acid desaturase
MGKGGESTSISNVNINAIENKIINDNLKFRTNFFESTSGEPHALRRKQILKVHPEIESLYGPDWRPAPIALCMIISQLILSYYSKFLSWPFYLLLVYFYGGTVSHSLSLMTHEASHCLIFKSKTMNEYFAMLCNIGMGIPAATTFKRYHMEHHLFQGTVSYHLFMMMMMMMTMMVYICIHMFI